MKETTQKKTLWVAMSLLAGAAATHADQVSSFTYNTQGKIETQDGPRIDVNDITSYGYDADQNLASITNALDQVVQLTNYNGLGLPQSLIDENGTTTQLQYNWRGKLTLRTVKSAQGDAATAFEYDTAGLLVRITFPDSTYLAYEYDDAQRLIATRNAVGERIEYTRDSVGNITLEEIKSSQGANLLKTQSRVFDELGRMIKSVGAVGQATDYGYDVNDNLTTITDPKQHHITRSFDALNRLITEIDPNFGETHYAYDNQSNLASVTDARGLTTAYYYDAYGNKTQMDSPDTGTSTFEYDEAGNRIKKIDARGAVTEFSYDALNRLLQVSYPAQLAENIAYSYDDTSDGNKGIGRLTGVTDNVGSISYRYDDRGNLIQESRSIDGHTFITQYSYDLANKLQSITYPSGRVVSYTFNALGRVDGVNTQKDDLASSETLIQNVSYLAFGPINSLSYGNGITKTLTHDLDYRLTSQASNVLDRTYSYDLTSNITSIANNLDSSKDQSFDYDALSRLTYRGSNNSIIDYQYDAVGNRTQRSETNAGNTNTQTYVYASDSNQLDLVGEYLVDPGNSDEWEFVYDPAGNLIEDDRPDKNLKMQYNESNRLIRVLKKQ